MILKNKEIKNAMIHQKKIFIKKFKEKKEEQCEANSLVRLSNNITNVSPIRIKTKFTKKEEEEPISKKDILELKKSLLIAPLTTKNFTSDSIFKKNYINKRNKKPIEITIMRNSYYIRPRIDLTSRHIKEEESKRPYLNPIKFIKYKKKYNSVDGKFSQTQNEFNKINLLYKRFNDEIICTAKEKLNYQKIYSALINLRRQIERDENNTNEIIYKFLVYNDVYGYILTRDKIEHFLAFIKGDFMSQINPKKSLRQIIIDALLIKKKIIKKPKNIRSNSNKNFRIKLDQL